MEKKLISFIRSLFGTNDFIPLHQPYFDEEEKEKLDSVIDSTYVSSVGKLVGEFEEKIAKYICTNNAIATVNGTSSLHTALILVGVL